MPAMFRYVRDGHQGGLHVFRTYHADTVEVEAWCAEQFGPMLMTEPWRWSSKDRITSYEILIKENNDAFAFRMRWC